MLQIHGATGMAHTHIPGSSDYATCLPAGCFWGDEKTHILHIFCENKGIDGRATIGAFLLIDFNIS